MMIQDDRLYEHFYTKTREFLLSLRNPKTKIFLLSGDVHHAEFTQDECSKHIHGYPIREFTSSSLTHALKQSGKFGNLIAETSKLLTPDTFNLTPKNSPGTSRFYRNNFGMIDFSFGDKEEDNWVEWKVKNTEGGTVLKQRFTAEDFSDRSKKPDFEAYKKCVAKRGKIWPRRIKSIVQKTITFESFALYAFFVIFWCIISTCCCILNCCRAVKRKIKKELDEAFCVNNRRYVAREGGE